VSAEPGSVTLKLSVGAQLLVPLIARPWTSGLPLNRRGVERVGRRVPVPVVGRDRDRLPSDVVVGRQRSAPRAVVVVREGARAAVPATLELKTTVRAAVFPQLVKSSVLGVATTPDGTLMVTVALLPSAASQLLPASSMQYGSQRWRHRRRPAASRS